MIAHIAQWYQYPAVARVLPGSNPGMDIVEFFYNYF